MTNLGRLDSTLCVAGCPKCKKQLRNYIDRATTALVLTHCHHCHLTYDFMEATEKGWAKRKDALVYNQPF